MSSALSGFFGDNLAASNGTPLHFYIGGKAAFSEVAFQTALDPLPEELCALNLHRIQLDVDDAAEGLDGNGGGGGGADFDDDVRCVADDIVGVTGVPAALCAPPTTLAVHLEVGRGVRCISGLLI